MEPSQLARQPMEPMEQNHQLQKKALEVDATTCRRCFPWGHFLGGSTIFEDFWANLWGYTGYTAFSDT